MEGLRAALGPGVEVVHGWGARIRRGLEPVSAGQVTDPGPGAGAGGRFLDVDGAVLVPSTGWPRKPIWTGREVVAGRPRVEVTARLRARVDGEHGIGVAGTGQFRLTAVTPSWSTSWPARAGDAAGLLAVLQRGGRMVLAQDDEVDLTVVRRLEPGATAASMTLAWRRPRPRRRRSCRGGGPGRRGRRRRGGRRHHRGDRERGLRRTSLALPGRQDDLVRAVAAASGTVVVVVNAGSPVELPWRDQVPAILLSWFPGQEFGHALADVLLGRVEPGGRLPTWPAPQADVPVLDTRPVEGRSSTPRASTSATAPAGPGPTRRSRSATASATPPGPTRTWRRRPPPTPATRSWSACGWPTAAGGPAARCRAYLSRPARRSSARRCGWPGSRSRAEPRPAAAAELRLALAFQHWWPRPTPGRPSRALPAQRRPSVADRPLTAEIAIR